MTRRIWIQTAQWSSRELAAIVRCAATATLSRGSAANRLEEVLRAQLGVRHVLLLNRGRTALRLGLEALAGSGRRKVIVPAFACRAVLDAVLDAALEPLFCDIDDNLNLDPDHVERLLDRQTLAVVAAHTYGVPADMARLRRITDEKGVYLVDDAASALGVVTEVGALGTLGEFGVVSFAQSKTAVAGAGGALITNSDLVWEYASRAPLVSVRERQKARELVTFLTRYRYRPSLGRLAATWDRVRWHLPTHRGAESRRRPVPARIANVDAELALLQIAKLPVLLNDLAKGREKVLSALKGIPCLQIAQAERSLCTRTHLIDPFSTVQRTPLRLISEGNLAVALATSGVDSQYAYLPLDGGRQAGNLTRTHRVADRLVRIPSHQTMSVSQVARLRGAVTSYVERCQG